MSELFDKQCRITRYLSRLLAHIHGMGWECTLGDAYRDPRVFGHVGVNKDGVYGHRNSNHKRRLAIDLNLVDPSGEYRKDHDAYIPFGEFWESLDQETASGIRFNDGNHFSVIYGGQR